MSIAKRKGKWRKRALSAVLAASMMLGMLELSNLSFVSNAATSEVASQTRVRRVMNEMPGDVPSGDAFNNWLETKWNKGTVGSADRPFTIVEVNTYPDYAEIGYTIEGCEPMPLESLTGNSGIMGALANNQYKSILKAQKPVDGTGAEQDVFFFEDEPEGKMQYYQNSNLSNGNTSPVFNATSWASCRVTTNKDIRGYYQRVNDGAGNFKLVENADHTKQFVKGAAGSGNIIWHTMNTFEQERDTRNGISHSYDISVNDANLPEVGSRFYTTRKGGTSDPYVNVKGKYYEYENYDVFARSVLGLTKQQAQNYSIQVATITIPELNNDPRWIDLADLIYINGMSNDENFFKIWRCNSSGPMNRLRLGTNLTLTNKPVGFNGNYGSEYNTYRNQRKDINTTVLKKIVDKVSKEENYAGLIINAKSIKTSNMRTKSITYNRYNVNNAQVRGDSIRLDGYQENIGKLLIMTMSLNPNLIRQIYYKTGRIEEKDGYATIQARGNGNNQEGMVWSGASFYVGNDAFNSATSGDRKQRYWDNYAGNVNVVSDVIKASGNKAFVNAHVYYYDSNGSIATAMKTEFTKADSSTYDDFQNYIQTNAKTKEVWKDTVLGTTFDSREFTTASQAFSYYEDLTTDKAQPFVAIRYILNMDNPTQPYYGDVNILELEPTTVLDASKNYIETYPLTKEQAILMLPNCGGDINITSMTMPSFNGRIDDLINGYDLIYLGDQDGGFVKEGGKTSFKDESMHDGWIYINHGDKIQVSGTANDRFGCLAYPYTSEQIGSWVREPANDITKVKVKDLEEFLRSGKPIVAAEKLFNYTEYIDPDTEMYNFLKTHINDESLLASDYLEEIDARVKIGKSRKMEIIIPDNMNYNLSDFNYDDRVDGSGNWIADGQLHNYLPRIGSQGRAQVNFTINVPATSGYAYHLYVDKNRNSKFEYSGDGLKNERLVNGADLEKLSTTITFDMPSDWIGCVQWRVEVYYKDKPEFRVSQNVTSAISAKDGEPKNKITALQIIPKSSNANLETGGARSKWQELYDMVQDFDIEVDTINCDDFNRHFANAAGNNKNNKFIFHMGQAIDIDPGSTNQNPSFDKLENIEKKPFLRADGAPIAGVKTLGEYNMLIFGFYDMYDKKNIDNTYGAAEYLYYFTEKGCSILFSHDLTCYYNEIKNPRNYGYTANNMMREYMGMNRYGVLSRKLYEDRDYFRSNDADGGALYDDIKGYMLKCGGTNIYDKVTKPESQGVTEWMAFKKLGINSKQYSQFNALGYMENSGWSSNCDTTRAKELNKGQICEYPFKIKEVLPVATTHSQYYELNLEDPEVTCWYTLVDDVIYGNASANDPRAGHHLPNGNQTLIYQVQGQEAASSYYIYSKGNIFYTGVGHTGMSSSAEMALFVNTMIAAYRPKFDAPRIVITNEGVINDGSDNYKLKVDASADMSDAGVSVPGSGGDYFITFRPEDQTGAHQVHTVAYYKGTSEKIRIYNILPDDGSGVIRKGTEVDNTDMIYDLEVGKEYMIVYPVSNVNLNKKDIVFETYNDISPEKIGKTNLELMVEGFFRLD